MRTNTPQIASTLALIHQAVAACACNLKVESFVNQGPSLDMVSSLIIGTEAAVIIDLPLAVPQANLLAEWVKNTTDKPLVAAFTTHSHPDHYLSGNTFLDHFPEAKHYATAEATAWIENEALNKVSTSSAAFYLYFSLFYMILTSMQPRPNTYPQLSERESSPRPRLYQPHITTRSSPSPETRRAPLRFSRPSEATPLMSPCSGSRPARR